MASDNSIEPIEYRNIPGFPGYRVGSDGSVWSKKKKRINWQRMKPQVRRNGYMQVGFHSNAGYKIMSVHTLVLISFIGYRPEGLECCHNDGNPTNNQLSNLRWDTPSSNSLDTVKHGRNKGFLVRVTRYGYGKNGEDNPASKLTDGLVKIIRLEYAIGTIGYMKLAKKYRVNKATIINLVKRRSWKHIA